MVFSGMNGIYKDLPTFHEATLKTLIIKTYLMEKMGKLRLPLSPRLAISNKWGI